MSKFFEFLRSPSTFTMGDRLLLATLAVALIVYTWPQ